MLQAIVKLGWRRLTQAALGLGTAALLTACGGGGGSAGDSVFPGGGSSGGGTSTGAVAADLVVTVSSATLPSDGSGSALVTVYAVDSKRNTLANVPVTLSVDSNALVTASAAKTDSTGVVTGTVKIGSDQTKRTINVTAVSGTITKAAQLTVVDPSATGTASAPTLTVSLSTTQITPSVPATVALSLKSATGSPLSGVVVSLSTSRGNLGTLSLSSVQTDANGLAAVTLTSNTTGATGADNIVAVANVGAAQVTGQAAFFAQGSVPTLSVNPQVVTLNSSNASSIVSATVLDAAGKPVPNALVSFASKGTVAAVTPSSQLTGANGVATVVVAAVDPTVSASDVLTASASVGATAVQGNIGVAVVGSKPTVTLTVSNSNVTATQPATLKALVTDASGAAVPGVVVQFKSQYGLVSFDASTATTFAANDANGNLKGQAVVHVSPVVSTSNGGDMITAQVTVNGVTTTNQVAVQVTSTATTTGPNLALALSSTSVSSGSPATVTATLSDSAGRPVAGQVVTFSVVRKLGVTNVGTALTNASGQAVALLSPASASSAGADEVVAAARYGGTDLSVTQGFQVQASNATIQSFTGPASLSAYGQDTLTLVLTGAAVNSPVKVSISSSCAAAGKATVSPSAISATSTTVAIQYRDNGCGAIQPSDLLQAVIDGTSVAQQLTLPIAAPAATSLAFISASPELIFLKGSGFTESSIVTFEVRDAAGNPLPNRVVELRLATGAGGVTMEGRGVESVSPNSLSPNPFTQTSNANGRVSVRVNSGTQPTPVRIHAKLSGDTVATVSSNLSVGVGVPSQLNFSLSQQTINIEGGDLDGTSNTYTVIASDRSGNPVPTGTAINFVTEGGQIETSKQTQLVNGLGQAVVNFQSSEPRPKDKRVTVTAYALGEESFIDTTGDNVWAAGMPFQDLGNIFKDRNFDGIFDAAVDEIVPLKINNALQCDLTYGGATAAQKSLLALDASIPSAGGNTCDRTWSGSGQVYVRRAVETVFSNSVARPVWPRGTANVTFAASPISLQVSGDPANVASFNPVSSGDVVCTTSATGSVAIVAADNNGVRLNPMPAGTAISATTVTKGFSVTTVGATVPNTREASSFGVGYNFDTASSGVVSLLFTTPKGVGTATGFSIVLKASCP